MSTILPVKGNICDLAMALKSHESEFYDDVSST